MTSKLAFQWLPCQAPGVIGSVLGLVGPVSVYCDWVRRKVESASSTSVWQHLKLSEQKVTKTISNKLDVFQNRCLRRILQIYWPNTITNEELHRRAEIEPISTQVKRRRWRWVGHVLRQQTTALTRIALRWTPDGQRKRGRPKETWRRTVEREMKGKGWTWGRLERVSADRHRWRALVEALCAT